MKETITTWADGYGRWHARVDFPSPGYPPEHLAAHTGRIRAKARGAIRREIETRWNLREGYKTRVFVADNRLDSMNRMQSITYAEKD